MATRRARRGWGKVRALPSGRFQASYVGPDNARHNAGETFGTRDAAVGWLHGERRAIDLGVWTPPGEAEAADVLTVEGYAREWLAQRDLRPSTRHLYASLLDGRILPRFGSRTSTT